MYLNRHLLGGLGLLILLASVIGCKATPTPTRVPVTIRIGGADAMELVIHDLADAYHQAHSYVTLDIQLTNTDSGLQQLALGKLDLALVARNPRADELSPRAARAVEIARDGIVVIVHPANPLTGLSRDDVSRVFAGEYNNWSELNITPPSGTDSIQVVSRENGSGTRSVFEQLVMAGERVTPTALVEPGERDVLSYVAAHPASVGYASFNIWQNLSKAHALAVDNVAPTLANIQADRYPLMRTFYLAVAGNADPEVRSFVDFCQSAQARSLIAARVAPVER